MNFAWYNSSSDNTNLATGNGVTFTTPQLSGSRTFSLGINACGTESRKDIAVTIKLVRIIVGGAVPAGPIPLVYSSNGTSVPSVVLQAETSPVYSGQYTWERNGLPLSETSSQLRTTLAGRYVVRIQGTGDDYDSHPVDVVEPLDGQTANGEPLSYFNEVTVLKPGVVTPDEVKQLAVADRIQNVTYANGFGQSMQQVAVQAGPGREDIVQHVDYTGLATTAKTYLPFPENPQSKTAGTYDPDAVTKLTGYYASKGGIPYTTATAEASPLERVMEQTQPGQDWAGHSASVEYLANEANEVRLWEGFDGTQWYPEGQLSKEVRRDPDNRETQIFKDQFGRVVLQRKVTSIGNGHLDTYNVYDEAGRLQAVIPPAAIEELKNSNQWNIDQLPGSSPSFKERWLFVYTYDERGRLITRQFPGASPVNLVYDVFDRPILVQDGNHQAAKQWLFTKFDAQNRTVVEGIYNSASNRVTLQNQANSTTGWGEFESRISNGYTTTNTFPSVTEGSTGNGTLLSITFYDDYDLNLDGTRDYSLRTESRLSVNERPVETAQTRGLMTATRRRVVQPGGQYGAWLTTVLIYDQYGNVVQKFGNNLLQTSTSLLDLTTLVYQGQGFTPQLLRSIKRQSYGPVSPVVVRNRYTYDYAGRPLKTWQQHEWQQTIAPEILLSSNKYEGLGELTQKRLHSRDGVKFLQYEDFTYDLHGQLKRINQSNLTANGENDLFGMELVREIPNYSSLNNTARFDGGISAISWSTHNKDQKNQPERERSYIFDYDDLGRLNAATSAARELPGTGWTLENGAYDERNITYDANGNILTVERHTQKDVYAPVETTDDMFMSYSKNGLTSNQLAGAYDYQGDARGFANSPTLNWDDYTYDANGSITHDGNKGVDYAFNTLNKVEQQKTGSGVISYTHDATGAVVKRETNTSAGTMTEYYVDGLVYEYSANFTGLRSVPTPEGRALVAQNGDTKVTYEYHLRDHLGNLRVAFRAQAGKEELRLSSEGYPTNEEGPYPKFENVTVTQSKGTSAKDGATVAAVTNASGTPATPGHAAVPGGPAISVPVADGDHLDIQVYCKTPYGVQYFRTAPVAPLAPKAAVALAVAPTLIPNLGASSVDGQSVPKAYPGIQLNVTGLLSALAAKKTAGNAPGPAELQGGGGTGLGSIQLDAYVAWTLSDSKGQTIKSGAQAVPVYNDGQWHPVKLSLDIDLNSDETRNGTLRVQEINDGSNPVFFDLLTITHPQDQALVSQENHYYPMGLPMSGVAVNTVPADVISKQLFNSGSDLQDEVLGTEAGVYSTFYRSYDPATGRFTGVDPLADSFADQTPYQFGNNDPINFNDPSGALSAGGVWEWLVNLFLSDGPGHQNVPYGTLTYGDGGGGGGGGSGGSGGSGGGFYLGSYLSYGGGGSGGSGNGGTQGGPVGRGGGQNTNWKPFFKNDLIIYYINQTHTIGTENDLGDKFEDIFETYAQSKLPQYNLVRNGQPGAQRFYNVPGIRGSEPDFLGNTIQGEYYFYGLIAIPNPPVPNSLWIETKQTSNPIPLSYDDGQIRAHIDNEAYLFRNDIPNGLRPGFGLATLAGVPYSKANFNYAFRKHIGYFHLVAEYRLINSSYEFRFVMHSSSMPPRVR